MNSFYPPWIGGAETYTSNLAKNLVKRGHDVTVYCSDRPLKAGESFVDGVHLVRMRTPATFYGTPIVLFPPKMIATRYDVIHANFPSPYLAGISAWIASAKNTRAVLTWHNDLPRVTSAAGVLVNLHDLIAGSYLDIYKKIIATTKIYSKDSKILRRYAHNVVVIPNGVDTAVFNSRVNGQSIRKRFGLDQSSKVALFVGALTTWHAYKGVDNLIKAFKTVIMNQRSRNDAKLLIVGGGNMIEHYRSLVADLGLSSSVFFAGRVDDKILPEYYAACDFAILPSRDSSEGFGLVLLEAMAVGKAVIGSRVGGIPEVIKDSENGLLVEPNNVDELARAIEILLYDDEKRIAMGRAGRMFAESLDWGVVAQKVESIYKLASDS
ncbi:MAG: glycosyltransferase family 4 protein [Nitrososphaerales archaeon]